MQEAGGNFGGHCAGAAGEHAGARKMKGYIPHDVNLHVRSGEKYLFHPQVAESFLTALKKCQSTIGRPLQAHRKAMVIGASLDDGAQHAPVAQTGGDGPTAKRGGDGPTAKRGSNSPGGRWAYGQALHLPFSWWGGRWAYGQALQLLFSWDCQAGE